MNILITGGCGFIGSNLIYHILTQTHHKVFNIDKLTYAGNLKNTEAFKHNPDYQFEKFDINDANKLEIIFANFAPTAVIHLAAESHVDKSIESSDDFIRSNINGTHEILKASRAYCLKNNLFDNFKFIAVSTDEVYGSLNFTDSPFTETTQYKPNSPYSASKAASDHLVRAWYKTYGLPTIITHCSNNYGPKQLPEKLIPKTIFRALAREPIPVYGAGDNIRDWIHVEDHCAALMQILRYGQAGESYCIGGNNEQRNIDIVVTLCDMVDGFMRGKEKSGPPRRDLITFVEDRLGHDKRYAVDFSKLRTTLRWYPKIDYQRGLKSTVEWYVNNTTWWL